MVGARWLWCFPVGWKTIMVENTLAAGVGVSIPFLVPVEFRGTRELLFGDVDLIAAELGIVRQKRPWQRIVILAEAYEAAKTHHRIGDLAAALVDHHALDLADAIAVR